MSDIERYVIKEVERCEKYYIYGVVTYSTEYAAFVLNNEKWCLNDWFLEENASVERWGFLEIAGNIHDNPELLKDGVNNDK